MALRVVLLGYGHLGLSLLQGLLESPHCEVVGVFRWSHRMPDSRLWEPEERLFGLLLQKHRLREIQCPSANSFEFSRCLEELKPDIVLVGSWGEIIKPHLLDHDEFQVINCHPSLLPKHRGANPYASAIRSGDTETGVTFHLMDSGIDSGPILIQRAIPIEPTDNGTAVRNKCAATARQLVPELFSLLAQQGISAAIPQDESLISYYKPLALEDGRINWQDDAPQVIHNQVRGLDPWLPCYSFLEARRMISIRQVKLARRSQLAPRSKTDDPPGTVQAVQGSLVWVNSREPEVLIGLTRYQIHAGFGFLPVWLSSILAPLVFRPGQQLGKPYWQTE